MSPPPPNTHVSTILKPHPQVVNPTNHISRQQGTATAVCSILTPSYKQHTLNFICPLIFLSLHLHASALFSFILVIKPAGFQIELKSQMLWKNLCCIVVLVSLKTSSNAALKYSTQGSQSLSHNPRGFGLERWLFG